MTAIIGTVITVCVASLVFYVTAVRYGEEKPRRGVFDAILALLAAAYTHHRAQIGDGNTWTLATIACVGFTVGALAAVLLGKHAIRSGIIKPTR